MMRESLTYADVMLVPQHGVLEKRADADISSYVVPGYKIQVPIISANMPSVTGPEMVMAMRKAGGHGVLHRFCSVDEAIEDYDVYKDWSVSIGLKDGIIRALDLLDYGAKIFWLDVAHGDHEQVETFIHRFRNALPEAKLVVGNIATYDAAMRLAPMVDGLKVGVGPGAACTTREVTGFGVGQLTAIMDVVQRLDMMMLDERPTVIADGGISNSGDIVKALAAGADTVMVGRLLAGCDEAPEPGVYYGNASAHVNNHNAPEGVYGHIERTGSVEQVMKRLAWGIRSGVSYGGATNLQELRENAEWTRVTTHTSIESGTRI